MANTVDMQMSAAGLGVAVIPALTGIIAQRTTLEFVPLLVIGWIILLFLLFSLTQKQSPAAYKSKLIPHIYILFSSIYF